MRVRYSPLSEQYADPEPIFAAYDQNRWGSTFAYTSADAAEALAMFEVLRATTSRLLRRCSETAWDKTGLHPEWGRMTVRQLLELYADHSERHLEQILAMRHDLAHPADVPPLLEERLY